MLVHATLLYNFKDLLHQPLEWVKIYSQPGTHLRTHPKIQWYLPSASFYVQMWLADAHSHLNSPLRFHRSKQSWKHRYTITLTRTCSMTVKTNALHACCPIDCPNLLVDSNLKGYSSFRIFWNVFDSENSIQKRHFDSSQNCKIAI